MLSEPTLWGYKGDQTREQTTSVRNGVLNQLYLNNLQSYTSLRLKQQDHSCNLCSDHPQLLHKVPLLQLSKWHCDLVSVHSIAWPKPARTLAQSVSGPIDVY